MRVYVIGCLMLLFCRCTMPANNTATTSVPAVLERILAKARLSEAVLKKPLREQVRPSNISIFESTTQHKTEEQSRSVCLIHSELQAVPIGLLLNAIAHFCKLNVLYDHGLTGAVSGKFYNAQDYAVLLQVAALSGNHATYRNGQWLFSSSELTVASQLVTMEENAQMGTDSATVQLRQFRLKNAKSGEILPVLQQRMKSREGKVWISANTDSNIIIAEGSKMELASIAEHIKAVDTVRPIFLIETWILEISERERAELGLRLRGQDSNTRATATLDFGVAARANRTLGIGISTLDQAYIGALQAIKQSGSSHIISHPRIYATQGIKATIFQGQEIPYVVSNQERTTTEFRRAGLNIELTPYRISDTMMQLQLSINKDSVVSDSDTPSIAKREISTSLELPIGATAVISGIRVDASDGQGDGIVGIGALGKSRNDERSQLVVLITVNLLRG